MIKTTKLVTLAALLLAVALPIASRADTIYSNLGPGSSYSCCGGWVELDVGFFTNHEAMAFTVPAGSGYDLTQIEIALTWGEGANSALLKLMSDSGGLPGSTIGSWPLGPLPILESVSTIQPSQTILGITGITLTGGTQYWLAPFPDPGSFMIWNFNTTGSFGNRAESTDGGSTWGLFPGSTLGAFAVYGDPVPGPSEVPEPTTLLLVGTGLAGFIARRRKAASR